MAGSLKPLGQIFEPKPTEPRTTPSLRELLTQPVEALDTYKVTPSLHALLKELFDKAVHRKGQGYWIRAEHGAGKTHFIAAATILLTNRDPAVWGALRDDALRKEYQAAISKPKLFPVTFSLLGTGEPDAKDSLVRRFEREIREALPKDLRAKVPVLSEELAVEWFENQAGELIKSAIASHFNKAHQTTPQEFRSKEGTKKFGAEISKVVEREKLSIELKGSFRERFGYLYDRITQLGGYDGLLLVVDEFRSWQDRHEGQPSYEEGVQLLETLAYYLPVEEHKNILLVVASPGDCPQKLVGSVAGDRFIVRELLKEQTDYGEIVCFRTRDIRPGKELEIEEYDQHCRKTFKFLKGTKKDYFKAIFPFQPQCFDILRRITQSYERYGLPAARSGIQDTAFLDRLHAYLPGWEMPVINPENYATGYGFMSDYLAEIFVELRRRNYLTHITAQASLPGMNQRNQDSIRKTAAGLLKLLHPQHAAGEVPAVLLKEILEFAVEMRKRVVDQLAVIKPAEFRDISFEFELAS